LPKEAQEAVKLLQRGKRRFDIIFLDPPYYRELSKKTLQMLDTYDILAPCGFIIVQHFKKDSLPDKLGVLNLFRQSKYGDTILSFYKKHSQ
jgi:16S rRNA G966 N2-methylase RsmD